MEVGDLAVVLDARTKEFRAALDQAEKRITKFEKTAEKGTEQAGRGFDRLGGRLGGLKAAVTGLVAAFGAWKALQLGKEAVRLASDYEQIEIQLSTLTGSAENAASVMKDVNQIVLRTPYSLEEMGRTAAYSALVFRDNTAAVSEFTGYIADMAAAFKRPVELIGENLPRAFSAGLGAADAFREAGISEEILRISGKTKVADVTTQDLIESIRKMTSEGGIAYRAAARQADSLGGVLSNTGIAADNLKRAFGEALSPAIVETGKEVLQPFFNDLTASVVANKDEIAAWARDTAASLVEATKFFIHLAEGAATAWARINDIIEVGPSLKQSGQWLAGIFDLGVAADWWADALGLGRTELEKMRDRAEELRGEIDDLSGKLETWNRYTLGLSPLRARGAERELAIKKVDLEYLEAQIRSYEKLQKISAAAPTAVPAVAAPAAPKFAPIDIGKLPGAGRGADKVRELKGMAEMSEVFYENAASAHAMLQATGSAASGIAWALRDAADEAERFHFAELGEAIGQDIRDGVSVGLVDGIKAGRVDAGAIMEGIADSMSTRLLEHGVDELMSGLEDGFSDLFSELGPKLGEALGGADFGPLSEAVGGALSVAAGFGVSMIMSAISGTKARQTFADIQRASGVTETREVQGIVAGPTTIAIAEVGTYIADAFIEPTALLREQLATQRAMLAALVGGARAPALVESEAGAILQSSAMLY